MIKLLYLTLGLLVSSACEVQYCFADNKTQSSENPVYIAVGNQQATSSLPNDEMTKKIIQRTSLEKEGDRLASLGFYDKAALKFKESMNPALFNYERDIAGGLGGLVEVYQRQGKFEEALIKYQWFLDHHLPENNNVVLEKKNELLALIKARDIKSNKPIYEHIKYLRTKYKKYIPPQSKGDSGFHSIPINDIIHLYDYMADFDGAIKFMEEILSSKTLYPGERKEYERVKAAFEEDKRTGQKGHLQEVIASSDYIGW